MIVGGYTVHLYCDAEGHEGYMLENGSYMVKGTDGTYARVANEFVGRSERQCLIQARDLGWRITRDKRAICPICR